MKDIEILGREFDNVVGFKMLDTEDNTVTYTEGGGGGTISLQTKTKTYTPTESQQTENVGFDSGYDGLEEVDVTVNAISTTYVGSGIDRNDSTDLTASGNTITAPAGYYESSASKSVASGTEGTPTASKGAVSNHSVSITPSVTNTAGYISGGTHSGTAVTVSASELASGTYTVDSSGTKDVTNYASASVPAGTAGTPSATKGAVSNHSVSVTPSVTNSTGWITGSTISGTAVSVSASELDSGTKSITANGTNIDVVGYAAVDVAVPSSSPNLQSKTKTYTPIESQQTESVSADTGYDGLGTVDVTVNAISSSYVGSGVTRRSSTDLSASGATVTAPAGYYENSASASVSSGSATPASSISATGATVSTGTNTLTLTKSSVSNTPQVSAGYVSAGTAGNSSVSLTASVTTQAAQTLYPSSSDQTIATDTYLTGTQTIKAVTTTNLSASNIKNGVTVEVGDSSDPDRVLSVTGTYEGGGGGGIDFSDIAQDYSYNNIGGLFKAFEDGTWDSLELTVVSGTNPIQVDFGRAIKGFIAYPKNTVLLTNLANNEKAAFTLAFFNPPDEDEIQTQNYTVTRTKNNSSASTSLFGSRIKSWTLVDGLLSLVPTYPSNNNYNPFIFGNPHIFVYWWEEE